MPLDQDLRAHDPDRWLSSRFVVDAGVRARLVALYTLDGEWARVASLVRTPLAGEIRLTWWRDALASFAVGGPAEHPALTALGRDAAARLLMELQAVIEARIEGLETVGRNVPAERTIETAAIRLLDPASPLDRATVTATAFPAIAHRTLDPLYAAGRAPNELEKRLRVTWAVLRGRL